MKRHCQQFSIVVLFALIVASVTAAEKTAGDSTRTVPVAVNDALIPPPPGKVVFSGWLGRQMATCRQGRIMGQSIPDLIEPFAQRHEDHFWQSEFWGKWFTSAALAYRYQADPDLRHVLDEAVAGLIKTQTPDGYIGNYRPDAQTKGWDIWGRKYVILGLLAYHDLTGDARALEAAVKEADYTLGQLGPGKTDIVSCGMWTGMAASSILEPMVLLYRRTGDKRYLDFAHYILAQWDTPHGPGLVTKALQGTPVYDMFPGPDAKQKGYMAGGSSKAYEMMSCYEGLLELYRVTGRPAYRQAVEKVAAGIRDTEITAIGSGSSWERWCRGHQRQTERVPEWMETCVTATWLKLNAQLLRLTGDPQYADQIEQTMYNSLIAAQKDDGTWWCHYNPLAGARQPAPEQCQMHMNCCVANGPRGLMLLPTLAVMTGAEGPVVNFYEPSQVLLPLPGKGDVRLVIASDYPRSGKVEITVYPQETGEFSLTLRIPAWSSHTVVEAAGQAVGEVAPGRHLRLQRTWKTGDIVRLNLDMTTRMVRDPAGTEHVALLRGPVVLALDKRITHGVAGGGKAAVAADKQGLVTVGQPQTASPEFFLTVDVPLHTAAGQTAMLRMGDYASAGHTWGPESMFRVWLPQPLDLADPLAGVTK